MALSTEIRETLKRMPRTIRVGSLPGGLSEFITIAGALAVAQAGDTIEIYPGTYAESNLTAKSGVNILGRGWGLSIIETTDNVNPIVAVGNNITCEIHGVKVSNLGTGGAIHVEPVANNSALTLEDCWVTGSGAGDAVVVTIGGAGNGTLNARRCDFGGNAATSIVVLTRTAGAGLLYFNSWDCNFTTSGGAGNAAIEVTAPCVANVWVRNSTFATCTVVFSTTGANHTFAFDACDFGYGGVTLTANVPVVTLSTCEDIGAFTHNTASTVTLNHCRVSGAYATGAVAAVVTAYATTFANFTHAGSGAITLDNCGLAAVANNSTATMTIRESHMDNLTQGAAAGTINAYNCSMAWISTGATGTIRLEGACRFTDISANAGVLTWKVDPNHIKVVAGTANMKVADALTLAAAGDVIEIYPGTFAESNLTLKASVDLVGTDPDQCLIVTGDAANPILAAGVTCSISNLTVGNSNAGAPAIRVTANTLTVRNCYVYGTGAGDAIAMTAGTLTAYDTRIGAGDIDLSTAICTLNMYRCQITTDPIDTAGAFAHVLNFENCDLAGQDIISSATGGVGLSFNNSRVGTIRNAGTSIFYIRDSYVSSIEVTNASGSAIIYGGYVNNCGAATGSVVWWLDNCRLKVFGGMKIAHALSKASSGDIIEIGQGTFAESNLTAKSGVNIIGEGWGLSIIETTDNANPIVAVGNDITCEIHGVKVSNLGTGGAIHVEPVANNSVLTTEDCWVTGSGAGDAVVVTIGGAGNGTLNARRCDFGGNAATSIVVLTRTAGAGLLYFNSWDCNFTTSGGAGNAAIEVNSANVTDVNAYRATFNSCTLATYITSPAGNPAHTVDIEEAEFNTAGTEDTISNPTLTLSKCHNIGNVIHRCTHSLWFCRITGTYTVGVGAGGILGAYHCSFGTITNSNSQAFSLYLCNGVNLTNNDAGTTTTIIGGHWFTITQGAAAGTIEIREAIVDTELDCSAGGTINAYNCQIDDIDCNGGTITLYGGQLQTVTDATGVIRWKVDPHTWRVIASTVNMKIANALSGAAAGDTILIGPGTFAESNLTLIASVNLIGTDPDQTLIVTGDAANPILLAGVTCTISNLTVGNTNAGAPAIRVTANTLTVRNCYIYGTGAGDAIAMVAGTLTAYDTRVGAGDIDLSTANCTLSMYRCQITADPVDTAGAFAHVMTMENCDFGGRDLASAATGATTLSMRGCNNVGTVSNLGTGTFAIQDSALTGVTVNNASAIIRLSNCQYRVITRTSGSIVDESPEPKRYRFKTLQRQWELLLVANQNIATRTAIGGLVTPGGSGQVRLRINDNAADAAGVENSADAAGSLDSSWTPARTPRYCIPISVNAFRATTTMFFGLRATLGAAVPTSAEHHAGFIWDGTNFKAQNSVGDGVNIQTTNLATPGAGAQHQLEMIVFGGVKVEYYVDGALVATHTTVAALPTAALDFQEYEISSGAGGATTSDITLREGFIEQCPA